jgi:hypothetical protein
MAYSRKAPKPPSHSVDVARQRGVPSIKERDSAPEEPYLRVPAWISIDNS